MDRDRVALSKTISHALRHAPAEYGLAPDEEGWVTVDELVRAVGTRRRDWSGLDEDALVRLNESSDKRRFEIAEGKIRAAYGHSLPERIWKDTAPPPDVLFHGTTQRSVSAIRADGLKPMRRQYVHLSPDRATARQVGGRRAGRTVVLEIDARAAHEAGVAFYPGNEDVWLSDAIPAAFIRFPDERAE